MSLCLTNTIFLLFAPDDEARTMKNCVGSLANKPMKTQEKAKTPPVKDGGVLHDAYVLRKLLIRIRKAFNCFQWQTCGAGNLLQ